MAKLYSIHTNLKMTGDSPNPKGVWAKGTVFTEDNVPAAIVDESKTGRGHVTVSEVEDSKAKSVTPPKQGVKVPTVGKGKPEVTEQAKPAPAPSKPGLKRKSS